MPVSRFKWFFNFSFSELYGLFKKPLPRSKYFTVKLSFLSISISFDCIRPVLACCHFVSSCRFLESFDTSGILLAPKNSL